MQGPLCKQAAFPVLPAPSGSLLDSGGTLAGEPSPGAPGALLTPILGSSPPGGPSSLWLLSDCHWSLSSGRAPMSFLALPVSPQGGFPGPGIQGSPGGRDKVRSLQGQKSGGGGGEGWGPQLASGSS